MSSIVAFPTAIVGLGFGRWVVRHLQRPPLSDLFPIMALCDADQGRTTEISTQYGIAAASLDDILADPAIKVVGLFTGPVGRADLIRKIIHAGKDVMTTKPFERDPAAALAIFQEAAALGRVIHLNSPAPVLPPDLARIAEWRHHYDLGAPVAAHLSTWAHYREQPDGGWTDDPALCPVAPIFRIGIYLINDALEFFGAPAEVQVMSSRLFTGRPTPDNAQLGIRFRNGGLATIQASFCVNDGDFYRNSLMLHFAQGTIYRNAGSVGRAGKAGHLSLIVNHEGKPHLAEEAEFSSISGEYQWEEFHRAIVAREVASLDFAHKVADGLKVIEAMARSEREGRPVVVA